MQSSSFSIQAQHRSGATGVTGAQGLIGFYMGTLQFCSLQSYAAFVNLTSFLIQPGLSMSLFKQIDKLI